MAKRYAEILYSHYEMMVNPVFFAVKVLPHQDLSLFIDSGVLPAGCTGHSNGSWHSRPLPGGKTWSENGGFAEQIKNNRNMMICHQTFAGRLFSGRAVSHVLGICLGWTVCVWTCLVIWNGSQYRIMVKIVVIKSVRGHHVQECFWCYFLTKKPALLSNPSMTSYIIPLRKREIDGFVDDMSPCLDFARVIHPQLGMLGHVQYPFFQFHPIERMLMFFLFWIRYKIYTIR